MEREKPSMMAHGWQGGGEDIGILEKIF